MQDMGAYLLGLQVYKEDLPSLWAIAYKVKCTQNESFTRED